MGGGSQKGRGGLAGRGLRGFNKLVSVLFRLQARYFYSFLIKKEGDTFYYRINLFFRYVTCNCNYCIVKSISMLLSLKTYMSKVRYNELDYFNVQQYECLNRDIKICSSYVLSRFT